MANDKGRATETARETEEAVPLPNPIVEAAQAEPKKIEDLVDLAQTEDTRRLAAGFQSDIKVPTDLSKVSEAKARELSEAGLVEDRDLPGKMYRRKADGFVTRIPDYTFNAYADVHKDEWEEIKFPTDEKPA